MLSTQPLKWQDIIFPILGATWFFFRPGVRSCIFVVQLLNCVWFFATPWTAARQASLSSPVSRSCSDSCLLSQWGSLSHPLLPPFTFHLSPHQGLFHWVTSSHQVAKVLELQLQHQSFQWIFRVDLGLTGLISFLSKGLLKSLLQHHSLKASILWCSVSLLYGSTLTSIHDY